MNEIIEKVDVEEGLYIYLQRNSKVWLARFKIDGKWISRTTKQRQQTDAFKAALKVRTECELKLKHGIAIQTKTFKDVARLAIERMATVPKGVKGYASMGEYKSVLERYHMPFFDRTHITSIDGHSSILGFPVVKGGIADTMLPADITYRFTLLMFV